MSKFKSALFVMLLLCITTIQFRQTFIVVDYLIHQEEITEQFCENKDRPEMECNGKCHLKKELKADYSLVQNTESTSKKPTCFLVLFNAISFFESPTVHHNYGALMQIKKYSSLTVPYIVYLDSNTPPPEIV